jgi:hypothetical protein
MSNLSLQSNTDNECKPPGWRHWRDRDATPSDPSSPPREFEEEGGAVGIDGQEEEDSDAKWARLEALEAANNAAAARKEGAGGASSSVRRRRRRRPH